MNSSKKESFRFDAYVPILVWFIYFEEHEPHKKTKKCLEEIYSNLKEINGLFGDALTKTIRIEFPKKVPKTVEKIYTKRSLISPKVPKILIKLSFRITKKEMRELYPRLTKIKDKRFIEPESKIYFVLDEFKDLINRLLFSINIARPGAITTDDGVLLCDGIFFQYIESLKPPLRDFVPENLPSMFDLDINQTWSWFDSYCKIRGRKRSSSKFERALHAYSYLFKQKEFSSDPEKILWSMLGIEALYANDSVEIVRQIKENMPKEVGHVFSRKKIDKLYNYRSRFMHGNKELCFNSDIMNDFSEDYTQELKLAQAANEITYILTYSLQKMIQAEFSEY